MTDYGWDYPPGAEHDPKAPWNAEPAPERMTITITVTLPEGVTTEEEMLDWVAENIPELTEYLVAEGK